jgi:Neuraminidase (sialidase)
VSGITLFSSTSDGGKSWSAPVTSYDPGPEPYPQWPHGDVITPLPDGTLLDVFGLMNNSPFFTSSSSLPEAVMAMRSRDGGRSWSTPTVIASVPSRMAGDAEESSSQTSLITFPIPSVASDSTGNIYVVWHENPSTNTGRILLSRSSDGGMTWGPPQTVDAHHGQAFLPAVAVSPNGVLGVVFYDTRRDTPGDGKLTTDLWFAQSHDRGRTWQQTHVAGPFDALTAVNFFNIGRLLGDSIDLLPAADGFNAVFTLARPLALTGPSSVYFAHILAGSDRLQRVLKLRVRPRHVKVGHRVRLTFYVYALAGRYKHPVVGAAIHLRGRRIRTSPLGRAYLAYTFSRRGRVTIIATKRGYRTTSTTVFVAS